MDNEADLKETTNTQIDTAELSMFQDYAQQKIERLVSKIYRQVWCMLAAAFFLGLSTGIVILQLIVKLL